jgi:hypothetical protein
MGNVSRWLDTASACAVIVPCAGVGQTVLRG